MTLKKKFTMDTSIFQSYYLMTHFLRSWVQLNFPCISNSVLLLSPVSGQCAWQQQFVPVSSMGSDFTSESEFKRLLNVQEELLMCALGSDQESLGFTCFL